MWGKYFFLKNKVLKISFNVKIKYRFTITLKETSFWISFFMSDEHSVFIMLKK